MFVRDQSSRISSVAGDISIAGQGGGNGGGVVVQSGGVVKSTGTGGNIDITGTGSGGAASIRATGIDAGSGVVTLTAPTGFIQEAEVGTDIVGSTVIVNGEVAPAGPGTSPTWTPTETMTRWAALKQARPCLTAST